MRLRALPLLLVLTAGLSPALPITAASAATAPSTVTIRSGAATAGATPPYSLAVVNGRSAHQTVGLGSADGGRLSIHASKYVGTYPNNWTMTMPRNKTMGTYLFDATGSGEFSVGSPGTSCPSGTGTAVIKDAAWTNGVPTRLSMSLTTPCGISDGATTHIEVRIGQDVTIGSVGLLEGPADSPGISTQVGTPVLATRLFTNGGTGPVTLGAAAIAWSQRTDFPPFSVRADGCHGKTLAATQSCAVQVAYDPKLGSHDIATLTVPDGRPRPAGVSLSGNATPQPDQPRGVLASGQLRSISVTWSRPSVSSSYSTYEVVEVDSAGNAGRVVASVPGDTGFASFRADIDALADRMTNRYAVRAVLPAGYGPLSVPVTATTAGRLLLFGSDGTLRSQSLDPSGVPLTRDSAGGTVEHQVLSPDTGTIAASNRDWNGYASTCTLRVLARTGTSDSNGPARPTGNTCDTFPAFTSATSVVFSRTDDAAAAATAPYLATYDLQTQAVTPVPGGAGLTQPAAAPDGSLVAVDPSANVLVRLTDGVAAPIAGTTGAREPAVAASGRLAFVALPDASTSTGDLVSTDAVGGDARLLVDNPGNDLVRSPSWTSDGATVYYATSSTVRRVPLAGGASTEVTGGRAPVVIDVPDSTGPGTASPAGVPPYTRATSLDFIATAIDPGPAGSGVATYDARYRTGPAGGVLGDAVSPTGWTGSASPSFSLPLADGQRFCVSARATDAAGNTGAWSGESCTLADRTLPMLATLSTPPLYNAVNRVTLSFSYRDTTAGVASYAVRSRRAAPGTGFGAYTTSAAQPGTSYALGLIAGWQYCFSVHATDRAGNVSVWSAERCTMTSLDDRALTSAGTVARVTSSAYHAGTATQLKALGAKLTYPKVSATRIGVLVRMCSTCGPVEVYVNGARLATLNTYSATARNRVLLWAPRGVTRTGQLALRQSTAKSVFIDAVVVQHT